MKKIPVLGIIIGVVAVVLLWFGATYNSLVAKREDVRK